MHSHISDENRKSRKGLTMGKKSFLNFYENYNRFRFSFSNKKNVKREKDLISLITAAAAERWLDWIQQREFQHVRSCDVFANLLRLSSSH